MAVYGLIPARVESSRLPRKALIEIHGVPMVIHVAMRAMRCSGLDGLWICTDSSEIVEVCDKYKVNVCLTTSKHLNGTERIAEAARFLGFKDNDIIIDIQGDEPLVQPEVISKVILDTELMLRNGGDIFLPHLEGCETKNPNVVKVVESCGRVLYLTRSDAPYNFSSESVFKKHLSVIGFSGRSLKNFVSLEQSPLERVEGVELLRALEGGLIIHTGPYIGDTLSVDVPSDLEKVSRYMMRCPIAREICGYD